MTGMPMNVVNWKIDDVRRALESRTATAQEIAEATFARIAEENPRNNSFLTVTEDRAMARAADVDRMVASGAALPPLAGVPVAVKDVIMTEGIRNTCSSRMLANFIAPYSAT